jgi:hypothetical protein
LVRRLRILAQPTLKISVGPKIMTPDERAKEIALVCGNAYAQHIAFITAQIREAVEENTKMLLGYSVNSEEALAKKIRAEAYEDAAKIADDFCGFDTECGNKIRARAKEATK